MSSKFVSFPWSVERIHSLQRNENHEVDYSSDNRLMITITRLKYFPAHLLLTTLKSCSSKPGSNQFWKRAELLWGPTSLNPHNTCSVLTFRRRQNATMETKDITDPDTDPSLQAFCYRAVFEGPSVRFSSCWSSLDSCSSTALVLTSVTCSWL
jgi:hypothetical protein